MDIPRKVALEVLGLDEGFSEEELTKAFKRLSKLVHPDVGGDERLFNFIVSCKEKLSKDEQDTTKVEDVSPQSKEKTCVRLMTLYVIFYDLNKYIEKYDIIKITGEAKIYIFGRNKYQEENLYLQQSFGNFRDLGFANFSNTLFIPENLKKFKVQVEFMGKTYKFEVSKKNPVCIVKYVYTFSSVLTIKFKWRNTE